MSRDGRRNRLTAEQFAELIREARADDGHALGRLFNAYRPLLLFLARAELGSELKEKLGPSDLVQETFVDAQQDFSAFTSHTQEEFIAWLSTLLKNNLKDAMRRFKRSKKREVRRELPIDAFESRELLNKLAVRDDSSPSRQALTKEEKQRLHAAIGRLSRGYREVILWRFQHMLSWKEIAARLERSEDAAMMLLNRAIKRLKKELDDDDAGQ
jgi:RNA polymerase sigma-70 factor (ECF subfamily)